MKHTDYFKGKIAVITGGGDGLGKALTIKLADYGAVVICTDKDLNLAENTVNTIRAKLKNGRSYALQLDVADSSQIIDVISRIHSEFGAIDFLFNNAGITIGGEIRDFTVNHWERIIDINLLGLITCSAEVLKRMSKARQGHIVNITSISGLMEYTPLSTPYAVSKHGAVTFSKALRLEALDFNVKVTTVCPGSIRTSIGETMEHVNSNERAKQRSVEFIKKGIAPELAAEKILAGVVKNKRMIIFPTAFRNFYYVTRLFGFPGRSMMLKMIREFRAKVRLG